MQGKEGLVDGTVEAVEVTLHMVEEFVQTVADDVLDVAIGQLRAQLPEAALRRVGESAPSGDPVTRRIDSSASITQKWMARGKSRSRMRNWATSGGSTRP